MAQEEYDEFMGGGSFTSFVFYREGDSILGTIMEPPEKLQQTDMDSGAPKFWDDGKPKWYFRLKLQTALRDPENADDDGVRSLALSWKRLEAVRAAVVAAGEKNLKVGGQLWLRFDKFEDAKEAKYKTNPSKKFWTAKYKPPVAEPEFMGDPFSSSADATPQAEPAPSGMLAQMAARKAESRPLKFDAEDIPTPNLDAVRAKIAAAGPAPEDPPF